MLGLFVAILAITLPTEPPAAHASEFEEQWRTDPYSDEYLMGNVMTATVDDEDEDLSDAEPAEIVIYAPKR